jgi:two-component system cell cycle sensor histidine kinase/response regulator CckA
MKCAAAFEGFGVLFLLLLPASGTAEEFSSSPPAIRQPPIATVQNAPASTITETLQIFELSTDEKAAVHPLRIEGRVGFFDRKWRNSWIERADGLGEYMPLSDNPPILVQGQRIRIDGTIVPSKGLDAATVTVTVLRSFEPEEPLNIENRICDLMGLNSRRVKVRAYVDSQHLIDDTHLRLDLVVENQPVVAWVKPENPRSVPNLQGNFIGISGLYQGRFDPTKTRITIELWTSDPRDLTVVGSIEDSHLFEAPLTQINRLYLAPQNEEVRIRGQVQSSKPGLLLVVRDATGQVDVHSAQRQRMQPGTDIEAVGKVTVSSAQWSLDSALFRPVIPGPEGQRAQQSVPAVLNRIDEIRRLGGEGAALDRPVEITGTVTWSQRGKDYFFLQDLTSGIRVRFQPDKMEPPAREKYLKVEGVIYNSGFAPAIDLRQFQDLGSLSPPAVRDITYEQAATGNEDGQFVSLIGFYQRTESDGVVRSIHMATPNGEFIALLNSAFKFEATAGSLFRISGVCEASGDPNDRLTSVVLHILNLTDIDVVREASADSFALAPRAIRDLRQISASREPTRVHVFGTVLYSEPGRLLYLEEGNSAILALSNDTQPLAEGEKIEAVGILGSEGVRPVLRDAVYRKLGSKTVPMATEVSDPSRLLVALDCRLVSMEGTLIDVLLERDGTRLTLQSGDTLYEALLKGDPLTVKPGLFDIGSVLKVTGIYKIDYDDTRQSRGFKLQLRSIGDVAVIQEARYWTLERSLVMIAILGGCTLLGIGWGIVLHRRVRMQTDQIREQLKRQAKLESELQDAARLESLGVLAGGIAHDFNNLLTIIMVNVSFAMLDEKVMGTAGEFLKDIKEGANRARALTQQLITFAKGGGPQRSIIYLPDIVRDTTEFTLSGSNVRHEFDLPADLWNASVDKDQIVQVIQNLVLNAMQAMPNGGIVRILLRNETVGTGFKASLSPGLYIRLTVSDSGTGISADILPRLFEPYFSTKNNGSGLGLATVYSIVKKHLGYIEAASAPGQGTTFTVWLPATDSPLTAATKPELILENPLVQKKAARVLLMDDDESIRQIGAMLLRNMGLEATLASEGAEAVHKFGEARDSGRPFDLLILDLTIPGGKGGRETIELIRKIDPGVPAIVSSGYSNDPVMADFKHFGFQAMVSKPYEVKHMTKTIRELLALRH